MRQVATRLGVAASAKPGLRSSACIYSINGKTLTTVKWRTSE